MKLAITTKGKIAIGVLFVIIVVAVGYLGQSKGWFDLKAIPNSISSKVHNVVSNEDKVENAKPSTTTAQPTNTINLSLDEWIGWKPVLDAQALGLYEKEGINVNINIINNATDSSNSLITGDLDCAGYTVNRYAFLWNKFKENKVDVVMPYIVNYSTGGDGIIATNNIKSIEDLVGKKVGIPRNSEAQTIVEWFLDKSNLTEEQRKQINYVYFETPDEAATAFFAGELDAAATWQPYLANAQASTDSHILVDTKSANNLVLDGLVFRKDFVNTNPDTVAKFIRATLKAKDEYVKSYTALKDNMSMFSTMSDEDIKNTLPDATLATYNNNIDLLSDEAQILFKDMSNIWIDLGETAYPDESANAFDTSIISTLESEFKTAENKKATVTTEQKEKVMNSDEVKALLNKQVSIEFQPNVALFMDNAQAGKTLDEFVEIAKMLNGSIIRIEGNSANVDGATTSSDFDKKLTEQRARTVANYLISKGIDGSRFIVVGNGISKQIADNSTEEGRKQNRRTDIQFITVE